MRRLILVGMLLPIVLNAQPLDPGSASHAGIRSLDRRFGSALAGNSAILARSMPYQYGLELFGAAFNVSNNSISTAYWNDHIAGDRYLSDSDIHDLVDQIPEDGTSVFGQLSVPFFTFNYNRFGGRLAIESAGYGTLPKNLVKLALLGNTLGEQYTLSGLRGESHLFLDYSAGFGHEFEQQFIPHLFAGAAFHFFQGLNLQKVVDAGGNLTVTDSLISGNAVVQALESSAGDGVGFDLAALAIWNNKWETGLSVRQLGASISWIVDQNHVASFSTDSGGIVVDSLDEEGYLDRAFSTSDTTYYGGAISTRLPVTVTLNAAYHASRKWNLLGQAELVTSGAPLDDPAFAVGAAAEYSPTKIIRIATGAHAGGPHKLRVGLGGDLILSHYELSVGWEWDGGLFNNARGVGVGITQRVKF